MPPIWKRRRDPLENLLRASRPEPRSEFAASVLARLEGERARFRLAGLRRRVLIAGFVTALAAGAAIAAGATTTLASSVNGLVQVAAQGANGNGNGNGGGNGNGNGGGTTVTTTAQTTTAAATAVTTTTDTPKGGAPVGPTGNAQNNKSGDETSPSCPPGQNDGAQPGVCVPNCSGNGNCGDNQGNGNGSNDNGFGTGNGCGESPGDHQYAVTICHHTGSDTNPWVELTLSPEGAANHLANHPEDFIVGVPDNCPSKK